MRTCDKIALLYGNSAYSLKALRLKMRYAALTDEQQNLLYPRSVPADEVRQYTDGSYVQDGAYQGDYQRLQNSNAGQMRHSEYSENTAETVPYAEYGIEAEPDISSVAALNEEPAEEYESLSAGQEAAIRNSDALAAARYPNEDEDFYAYVREMEAKAAQQRAAAAARLKEEERQVAIKAENEKREAEARQEAMRLKARAQQEAMEQQAEQTRLRQAEEHAENASELSETEGQQMALDFGDGKEEPRVIEEPEEHAYNEQDTEVKPEEALTAPDMAAASVSAADGAAAAVQDAIGAAQAAGVTAAAAAETAVSSVPTLDAVEAALNSVEAKIPKTVERKPNIEETKKISSAPKESHTKDAAEKAEEIRPKRTVSQKKFSMIVEAETIESGLSIAIEELKAIHEENGIRHASTKTTADKINAIGFTESVINKIRGKDLVIEKAGELDDDVIESIYRFIKTDKSGTIIIMIDTPDGLDHVEDVRPELFDICDYISDVDDDEAYDEDVRDKAPGRNYRYDDEDVFDDDEEPYDDEDFDEIDDDDFEDDDDEDEFCEPDDDEEGYSKKEPKKRSAGNVKERFSNVKAVKPAGADEQMEIDDFAQYCSQFAAEIDCSITGKSMLALYERIELMEEDGIPLTKANAEALIEEAADRAEKPPIGKRLSNVFHSKYDKNGCLILKEDDFIY